MAAYRTHEPRDEKPIRIPLRRPWGRVLIFLTIVICPIGAMYTFGGSVVHFVCSRASGTCIVEFSIQRGEVASKQTVPIARIERATIGTKNSESGELSGIALVIDGKDNVLYGESRGVDVDERAQRAWVEAVNAFLKDPTRERLDLDYPPSSPSVLMLVLGAIGTTLSFLILLPVLFPTVIIVDRARGVMAIVRGVRRRKVTIALADVARAELRTRRGDEAEEIGVVVVPREPSKRDEIEVTEFSSSDSAWKQALIERINAALS